MIDPATHAILDVNRFACAEYGYTREEFLRLSITDIDALGDSAALRARGRAHAIRPLMQEFEAQHRTKDGTLRDVLMRVQGVRVGGRDVTFGVHLDITARKAAEEQCRLLMREVDHRAKNVLAIVQALLALTPGEGEQARRFAAAVAGRVSTMARAHNLLARERWHGADLGALVAEELAPYAAAAGRPDCAQLDGPALTLAPAAAQPLSMVLHELATNASKYGALSTPDGTVAVAWRSDPAADEVVLDWHERSGPCVDAPPTRRGFGSRLVERMVRQLGGRIAFDWRPDGLRCTLRVPADRLRGGAAEAPEAAEPPAGGGRPAALGVRA